MTSIFQTSEKLHGLNGSVVHYTLYDPLLKDLLMNLEKSVMCFGTQPNLEFAILKSQIPTPYQPAKPPSHCN